MPVQNFLTMFKMHMGKEKMVNKMKLEWKNCFKIVLSVFVLYLCILYWRSVAGMVGMIFSASFPLFIGFTIAYPVNILMSFYEKHYFPKSKKAFFIKSRRPLCMCGAFLSFIAILFLVIWLILPQLISCVRLIISVAPEAIKFLILHIEKTEIVPKDMSNALLSIDWQSRIDNIIRVLTSGIGNMMEFVISLITSIFSGIVTTILSITFAIYLLLSKNKLQKQFNKLINHYLPEKICKTTVHFFETLNDCFHSYIVGQCTEAVILGLLCTLGMLLLRLPYATMIGALIAFTALIPVAGAYIGAFVGAFMIVMISPIKALIFLIFIVVLQQVEGNIIYPKVVGSSIGLPGIWVLAAVTVGGGIMGIAGMLLGVPLAACAYRLIREDIYRTPANEKTEAIKTEQSE